MTNRRNDKCNGSSSQYVKTGKPPVAPDSTPFYFLLLRSTSFYFTLLPSTSLYFLLLRSISFYFIRCLNPLNWSNVPAPSSSSKIYYCRLNIKFTCCLKRLHSR